MNAAPSPTPSPSAADAPARLRELVQRLARREDLSRSEAQALLESLLDPGVTEAQIAAALVALAMKGETTEELAGMAAAMRARAVPIRTRHTLFVDTAGTGCSSAKTFNVSTAAAFVIAGAGVPVAKHGNRAVSSRSGSADVLEALGVRVDVAPEVSQRCLDELGICFLFAPLYHRATARVAAVRRQLGIRTAFNVLGPLTNPAGAPRQVVGVWDASRLELMARALAALGTERAWVLCGCDGLDEVTLAGATAVAEAVGGEVVLRSITPGDLGLEACDLSSLRGGDAQANAALIRDVLERRRHDAPRALVIANAAVALFVAGVATSLREAAAAAAASIDSGAALKRLAAMAEATNS